MKYLPKYNPFEGPDYIITMTVIMCIILAIALVMVVGFKWLFAIIILCLVLAIAAGVCYMAYRVVRYMYVGK